MDNEKKNCPHCTDVPCAIDKQSVSCAINKQIEKARENELREIRKEHACGKAVNAILDNLNKLRRMYKRSTDDDDSNFHIYMALIQMKHFVEFMVTEKTRDEIFEKLKEWEIYRKDVEQFADERFIEWLTKKT